jgi:hypothetical protein
MPALLYVRHQAYRGSNHAVAVPDFLILQRTCDPVRIDKGGCCVFDWSGSSRFAGSHVSRRLCTGSASLRHRGNGQSFHCGKDEDASLSSAHLRASSRAQHRLSARCRNKHSRRSEDRKHRRLFRLRADGSAVGRFLSQHHAAGLRLAGSMACEFWRQPLFGHRTDVFTWARKRSRAERRQSYAADRTPGRRRPGPTEATIYSG